MNNLLLIDSSYLGYQAYFTTGQLRHEEKDTGIFYGFLRRVRSLGFTFQTNRFAFCWDAPGLTHRRKQFPQYKANRSTAMTTEERSFIGKQFDDLRNDILWNMGFRDQLEQDGVEADDIIAIIANSVEDNEDMIIVSADNDLLQCLRPGVRMYAPTNDKMSTHDSFQREYGISVSDWVEAKALAGDETDNIPGAKGVGIKTACKYLRDELGEKTQAFKTIQDFYDCGDADRNVGLMWLPHEKTIMPQLIQSTMFDPATFIELCEDYGFKSFLMEQEMSKWLQFFANDFKSDEDKPPARQGIQFPKVKRGQKAKR